MVSQKAPNPRTKQRSPAKLRADLQRLRAELRAANPDMSEADWVTFADRIAAEVDDGLRERVRQSRGKIG